MIQGMPVSGIALDGKRQFRNLYVEKNKSAHSLTGSMASRPFVTLAYYFESGAALVSHGFFRREERFVIDYQDGIRADSE